MAAAQKDFKRAVMALLAGGAVVDQRAHDGRTALLIACQHDSVRSIPILLERGADPNAFAVRIGHVSTRRRQGARRTSLVGGKEEGTHDLFLHSLPCLAVVQTDGLRSPLFVACREGHIETVRLLIESGLVDVNRKVRKERKTRETR